MNPLNFKEFVQNRSKDEKLFTPSLKPNPKLVFLRQEKQCP